MKLRFGRVMQGKQVALFAFTCFVTVIFLAVQQNRLKSEIAELQASRLKLEHALAKYELNGGVHRRVPAQYIPDGELGDSLIDDSIIIYNRVPKTGSTSFAGIAYDLCTKNKFNVLHVNTSKNNPVLSLSDQMRFINNITSWHDKKPALYHGHVAYLEFARFGVVQKPIYINIIRDPLERLISYYYFLRHGDNFRPHLKRRRSGDNQTFDDCVARDGTDCDPENLWVQIPFFCGHAAECWVPGNHWALEKAKHNLVNNYLLVGLTEEMGEFVAVLEATLPRYFAGATDLYNSGRKSHLRKTYNKTPVSDRTIKKIQQSEIWQMEEDFYRFTKEHFHFVRKKTLEYKDGVLTERKQSFMYEKVRPM